LGQLQHALHHHAHAQAVQWCPALPPGAILAPAPLPPGALPPGIFAYGPPPGHGPPPAVIHMAGLPPGVHAINLGQLQHALHHHAHAQAVQWCTVLHPGCAGVRAAVRVGGDGTWR